MCENPIMMMDFRAPSSKGEKPTPKKCVLEAEREGLVISQTGDEDMKI
jgi:hypothetical protein